MKLSHVAAAAILALSANLAQADEYREDAGTTPSGAAMAADLILVRPLGAVATVLGVGLFVLNLPLSIVQGEPPSAPAQRWIVEPARYTFSRPLGQME
ncbi:MAG TPA: hypothetical protein VGE22_16915 [Solimonas sp.]